MWVGSQRAEIQVLSVVPTYPVLNYSTESFSPALLPNLTQTMRILASLLPRKETLVSSSCTCDQFYTPSDSPPLSSLFVLSSLFKGRRCVGKSRVVLREGC